MIYGSLEEMAAALFEAARQTEDLELQGRAQLAADEVDFIKEDAERVALRMARVVANVFGVEVGESKFELGFGGLCVEILPRDGEKPHQLVIDIDPGGYDEEDVA